MKLLSLFSRKAFSFFHRYKKHSLLGIFIIVVGILIQQHVANAANTTIQATLNPATTGNTISATFLGNSIEPWRMCDLLTYDQGSPASAELFKTLGQGTIRLGGASGDQTIWTPNGTPSCSFNGTVVTKSLVDEVFAFARKTNRKVTYLINLQTGNPTTEINEATYAAQSGGTQLQAFEIGNEPDLYGISFAQYQTKWEAMYNAVHGAVPNVPIIGPSVSFQTGFFASAITSEGNKFITSTAHPYATVAENNPTPQQLLSQATLDSMTGKIDAFKNAANNLPLDLNETNAVANTPPASIGDAYDMSLWGADYAFAAAEHGVSGMEFHGGIPGDETSPFNGSNGIPGIRPLYYGMLVFHYAVGNGGKVVPVQYTSSINLRIHSVLRNDGKLAVIVVNKDENNSATTQINTTATYTHATAVRLSAPSITSAINTTSFGGSQVNTTTGTWTPTQIENIPVTGATSSIDVPAASAVVILYDNGINTTPQPTLSPTPTLPISVTPPPGTQAVFSLTLCPHGLGHCGDNQNPNGQGNTNPQHSTRPVTLTVLNANNTSVGSGTGIVSYNTTAQNFQGSVSVAGIPNGNYILIVTMNGFLSKQIPGIIPVSQGQTVSLPSIPLVNGDIFPDNQLDISDYNLLISCFGTKQTTSACLAIPTQQTSGADITDDGVVDGKDYNLFLRELSVQHGTANLTLSP